MDEREAKHREQVTAAAHKAEELQKKLAAELCKREVEKEEAGREEKGEEIKERMRELEMRKKAEYEARTGHREPTKAEEAAKSVPDTTQDYAAIQAKIEVETMEMDWKDKLLNLLL